MGYHSNLGPELVAQSRPMALEAGGTKAAGSLVLKPGWSGYRIVLEDVHHFSNAHPPRRNIRTIRDEKPAVVFLPEHFPARWQQTLSEETEVEGMPLPLDDSGGKVRIAYYCSDAHGLVRARLRYRITRREDPENPGPWQLHELDEKHAGPELGPFNFGQGAFAGSGLDDQIEFYAQPSFNLDQFPGRTEGGGRFDFQTAGLGLRRGDQIEFKLEVFDRHPEARDRAPGYTDPARVKLVVDVPEFLEWWLRKKEHEDRIRALDKKQREIRIPASGP